MSEKLAILGGDPVRKVPFPAYRTIGPEEKQAVMEVMDDGVLSQFLGTWSPDFFGGPRVQKLEREWAHHFGVKHAITMNSATSGLYAAVGASGAGPGDEVVVSPYTMAASATAAVVYGAIPVFADIDPRTFCISAETIRERLSPYTKAIVVVDIFGYPADFEPIMRLAQEHNIVVIEDAAQSPGARRNGKWAGTLADIGVFSLNYHKTIHTGEGGVAVTDDTRLAERLQLIRNHAEVVVGKKGTADIVNMVGFNYRMTEIEAAIGSEQLKKLERLVSAREALANRLTAGLRGLAGLTVPEAEPDIRHGYYLYTIRYDSSVSGIPRDQFAAALRSEGLPVSEGYVRPNYLEPMYQQKIAFGRDGFPFTYGGYKGNVSYDRGLCPVAEQMHFEEVICLSIVHANATMDDMDDAVAIFRKVVRRLSDLVVTHGENTRLVQRACAEERS
jgi:dTDP-4-amino-4,6-dideoxygalactose transaminase